MKILYGVCGEGFGHSSRAKEIIRHLQYKGHKVLVLTYGQAVEALNEFNLIKTEGITLSFNNEKFSILKTAKENIKKIPKGIKNWKKVQEEIHQLNLE